MLPLTRLTIWPRHYDIESRPFEYEENRNRMSDPAAVRRQGLARLLSARGFVRVADASLELGVSEVTIRADLSALARDGRAVRVHGGAMPAEPLVRESPVESTRDQDAAAKRAIGVAAARLVSSGDCVYLDAGSTALAVAEALLNRRELHDVIVVTSALALALALEPASRGSR
jgi:DeoR family transcriptional regulator of aga operon